LGRLKTLSGREVCAILAVHGFVSIRQRGSHLVMEKRMQNSTITVPVPDHAVVRVGTLLSIIRQSGLSRTLFEYEQ